MIKGDELEEKHINAVSDADAGAALRMLTGEPVGTLPDDAEKVFNGCLLRWILRNVGRRGNILGVVDSI